MDAIDTAEVGGLIVRVVYDDSPSNPREDDNLSVIYGQHRRYTIGDGEPPADELRALNRGGIRLLARYLRLCKGALAITGVGMYDHSGVSYYPVEVGSRGTHAFDSAGWDSGTVGYAYVTKARADEMGSPYDSLDRQMAAEIAEYSAWANGEVYGYEVIRPCADAHHAEDGDDLAEIADCPHSDTLDSCWGFIGESEYAMAEGKSSAYYLAAHPEEVTA